MLETRGADAASSDDAQWVSIEKLVALRSWHARLVRQLVQRAERNGLLRLDEAGRVRLTQMGLREAERVTYDHRLWELFLTRYADIAPNQVDRGADAIEHVLDAEMIAELESLLPEHKRVTSLPPSLHPTQAAGPAAS